jgi:hypothetical protein
MTVTVANGGLSIAHTGSNGIAAATVPDVCKTPTPAGPVPTPYPNLAMSSSLTDGTRTITADGGNSCAHKPSKYGTSTGDEAGTVGGVKSNVIKGDAAWITYSFDLKFEGEGACRLSDKLTNNKQNTVCL